MTNEQTKLKALVEKSINIFNCHEEYLLDRDLSERCICSKFSIYLHEQIKASEFGDYIVDVEYNRGAKGNEYLPKILDDKIIVVDLIVHKRGYNEFIGFDNLICIEMKKSTNRIGSNDDEKRLNAMTDGQKKFGYKIGFMIIANMESKKLEIKKVFLQ